MLRGRVLHLLHSSNSSRLLHRLHSSNSNLLLNQLQTVANRKPLMMRRLPKVF